MKLTRWYCTCITMHLSIKRLGYASAIAWVLFFCMLIITGILMKQQKRLVNYDS